MFLLKQITKNPVTKLTTPTVCESGAEDTCMKQAIESSR